MRNFHQLFAICTLVLLCASCSSTRELTINTIAPSPVDFSNQIKKIGIVNSSKSAFVNSYSTRFEQLIVLEERWLAEKGTEAALTGLFDELTQDQRFDTVRILENLPDQTVDFGTDPSNETWNSIADLCELNGVDALFSLAFHDTDTKVSFKKTKMQDTDMMRESVNVSGQEITLETLIENGWRIYDPKQKVVIDEFTSNEQIVSSAKGITQVDALQAIDKRRETLLEQSKIAGSTYGMRMQPQKLAIQRAYYVTGTRNFSLADAKIQNGDLVAATELLEKEVGNRKSKISARACYNLAVINESKGDLSAAMHWASQSYDTHKDAVTLDYIATLEKRSAQKNMVKEQLTASSFELEE